MITKVICFTSPDARAIRKKKSAEESLIEVDQFFDQYDFDKDFNNLESAFYQHELDEILRKELHTANLILDLTPLSKLYSLRCLSWQIGINYLVFLLQRMAPKIML